MQEVNAAKNDLSCFHRRARRGCRRWCRDLALWRKCCSAANICPKYSSGHWWGPCSALLHQSKPIVIVLPRRDCSPHRQEIAHLPVQATQTDPEGMDMEPISGALGMVCLGSHVRRTTKQKPTIARYFANGNVDCRYPTMYRSSKAALWSTRAFWTGIYVDNSHLHWVNGCCSLIVTNTEFTSRRYIAEQARHTRYSRQSANRLLGRVSMSWWRSAGVEQQNGRQRSSQAWPSAFSS